MATIIDSAPSSITIPRDDCVEVVIVAHNDDGQAAVLGSMDVSVGDQVVHITATVPGVEASPVVFGTPVRSNDLISAGVQVINQGNGRYLVCGPEVDASTHVHAH